MQMHERKYIRFDFTQALHTRATSAERRDYRIIARARPLIIRRRERSRTPFTLLQRRARFAREASARQWTQVRSIPDLPRYCRDLRDSRVLVRRQFITLADSALRMYNTASNTNIRRADRLI